jgi:hypothetical protein
MTPDSAARHGARSAAALLLACASVSAAVSVRADGETVLLFKGGEPPDAPAWRTRVAARSHAALVHDLASWAADGARGVEAPRLAPLAQVETLLARAREQAAALDERGALATLAEAARVGEQIADVPGAALWNAEIQLGIGVTAAQAGMRALAEEAFRRAATLDRERTLRSGEATPAAVALYASVHRQVAVAALGELEVQVDGPRAQVFLDDVARGWAPVRVRVPVGRHVLRVHAEGHRPYGAFIDVLEGVRPPLRVQPAPAPAAEAAAALQHAAHTGDYRAVIAAAAALERAGMSLQSVHVLERSERTARALLLRCDAASCDAPVRYARGAALPAAGGSARFGASLAQQRRWLAQPEMPTADEADAAWWQRWYVWGGVTAAAAAAVAVLALGAAQEPERRLRVVVVEDEALGR